VKEFKQSVASGLIIWALLVTVLIITVLL